MAIKAFTRPFTQQEPINQEAIEAAIGVLKSGRLHRYNTIENERSEASLLEEEYAAYQGSKYCLACASGCLLYTSPSPRDRTRSRMPSSA